MIQKILVEQNVKSLKLVNRWSYEAISSFFLNKYKIYVTILVSHWPTRERMFQLVKANSIVFDQSEPREREHFLEIFKIKVDEITLP